MLFFKVADTNRT